MSDGLLAAPDAVLLAAGALPVLTAPAAAVLAVHAASIPAAHDGQSARGYADGMQESAVEARPEVRTSAADWQTVAAIVCDLNARLRLLAERAGRAGVPAAVPDPLGLEGRTVDETVEWSQRVAIMLRDARAAVCSVVAADEATRLSTRLPPSAADDQGTAEVVAELQRILREREADQSSEQITEVGSALRTLDPDAGEQERLEILLAAFLAMADADAARGLTTRVAAVNALIARRRLAARFLSALEDPIARRVEPPGPFLGTASKLRAVVVGDEDLTPRLHAEAAEAAAWAAEVARQCFIHDVMRGCLTDRGYTVADGEFDSPHSAELRITRSDWDGGHCAEVWVDRHGAVHGRIMRGPGTGDENEDDDGTGDDEATRCDCGHRDDFNADVVALGHRLDADVVIDEGYIPRSRGRRTQASTIAACDTPSTDRQPSRSRGNPPH